MRKLGNPPHTEAMRVTERFRRLHFGSMEVEFAFEDLEAFTRPWSEVSKMIEKILKWDPFDWGSDDS